MKSRRNNEKAQSAIELVAGAMVIIPLVLFGIDCSVMYMGQSMNASICRDAARAAASGPPTVLSPTLTPRARAEAVVRRSQKTEGAIRLDPNPIVTETVVRTPTQPFGGMVEGTVTVRSSVDVYPPFIIRHCVNRGAVRVTAEQTFPFTWVMTSAFATLAGTAEKNAELSALGNGVTTMSQPVRMRAMDAPLPR